MYWFNSLILYIVTTFWGICKNLDFDLFVCFDFRVFICFYVVNQILVFREVLVKGKFKMEWLAFDTNVYVKF